MTFVLRDIKVPFVWNKTGFPAPAEGGEVHEQNIRSALLTTVGERLHRPNFGSWLRHLLQQNISFRLLVTINAEIRRVFRVMLPGLVVLGTDFRVTNDKRILVVIDWDEAANTDAGLRREQTTARRTLLDFGVV